MKFLVAATDILIYLNVCQERILLFLQLQSPIV
jgi:hypothetical protein